MRKRKVYLWPQSHAGSVADVLSAGICVIAMTVLMLAYTGSIRLLNSKAEIDQIARKYILRMETVGYLTAQDSLLMTQELAGLGVTEIDYTGSTMNRVSYGEEISLVIHGKIPGKTIRIGNRLFDSGQELVWYELEEHRVSTAKN